MSDRFRPRSLFGRLALGFAAIAVAAVGMSSLLVLVIVTRDVHVAADAEERDIVGSVADTAGRAYAEAGSWSKADLRLAVALGLTVAAGVRVDDEAGGAVVAVPEGGPAGATDLVSVPIVVGGRRVGTATAFFAPGGRRSALDDLRRAIPSVVAAGAVLGVVVAIGAALAFSRRMARPLGSMSAVARDIAAGQWGRRVGSTGPAGGARELVDLATSLDRMADALVEHEVLRRAMVADVAHELRTPLTVLRASMEALADEVVPASPALVSGLHDHVLRLSRTVEDLEALAAADETRLSLVRQTVDLGAVVAGTAHELGPQFEVAGIDLRVDVEPVTVAGDAHRLHQVTSNLLSNALKFSPAGHPVSVSVRRVDGVARLVVGDEGTGIPADELDHVVERFWRGRNAAGVTGSGIGLTVVSQLVLAHEGRLDIRSQPGLGTTVTVELPVPSS
ncbi:MAG: two-component system, OmpR family, sensor histidine kinase BaeS [Actinomycetota bacterium]|jgi:signal transduction histidine kinase|nr:two-component system, OmpR family, sensor histidine kinase BaeS [Actinomycetota bacterium]